MSNSHLHPIFAQALEPFAPKEERKPVMLWAPKDTDYVVERDGERWAVTSQRKTAPTLVPYTYAAEDCNQAVADLREYGFVVYDPQEFHRNARPLTGVDDPHGSD